METLLVNDKEASRLLAISRSKFHTLVAEGRIARIKLGRSARYRRADLLAFTAELDRQPDGFAADPPLSLRAGRHHTDHKGGGAT
jgi:excisionase family DNA binding protein